MTTSTKPTARSEPSPRKPSTFPTLGYAAQSATSPLEPFRFERREPGPHDVQIDILFCGVCHSDLHTARDEWARHHLSRACPATRSSAASPRVGDEVDEVQGRRPGRRRLHGRFLPHLRRAASEGLEQYCDNELGRHLQQPRQAPGGDDLRRLLDADRGRRGASCSRCPPKLDPAARRRCSAPASPPTRRCATGTSARARRSASSASAASATWA